MKNIVKYIYILGFFLLVFPISCQMVSNDKEEYTIKYYIDEQLVEHSPSSYQSGEEVVLEDYYLNGYEFMGWYSTPNYSGDRVLVIDENTKGNLNFYGYLVKYIDDVKTLDVNSQTIEVEYGTSFDDVIKDLVVTYTLNEDTITLTSDQYELDHQYNPNQSGEYLVNVSYLDLVTSFNIIVLEKPQLPYCPSDTETLKGVTERENAKFSAPLGSIGTQNVLVIPIDFIDYPAPSNMSETLNTVLFGSGEVTGWESLNSYYLKSSYNKLNIQGTVLPVYHTNKYSTRYDYSSTVTDLINSALSYYDHLYDFSEFDNNVDGTIDAIYLVYSREPDYYDDYSNWWAYTYDYLLEEENITSFDNVTPSLYTFLSYHFLFETPSSGISLTYNLETFIHETGHLLGLEDYYDYDLSVGPSGGIGGGDMMDSAIGDHNPFSKTILGWTTPYLVTDDIQITLNSFGKSGDCIIIPKKFNGTYFDEYYIIDYYTPDGLNELEKGELGLWNIDGIRIYHINAETTGLYYTDLIWSIYQNSNSYSYNKLIKLIEADNDNNIEQGEYGNYSENSDLFQEGIYTDFLWYDGTNPNFTIEIVKLENGEAILNIDFE